MDDIKMGLPYQYVLNEARDMKDLSNSLEDAVFALEKDLRDLQNFHLPSESMIMDNSPKDRQVYQALLDQVMKLQFTISKIKKSMRGR